MIKAKHHIHLLSDSSGETLSTVVRAALAPFEDADVSLSQCFLLRTDAEIDVALRKIEAKPGLVIFTLVNRDHRKRVEETAARNGYPSIPVLDPLIGGISDFLGRAPAHRPGMQHKVNAEYFNRITALDFAIAHDDGQLAERLRNADVILTGVSRTSKTPTCIYLAYRGIKAANMPLVPGREPDPAFFEALEAGTPVIGLTASPNRLAQIRSNRVKALGDRNADYADIDRIREEVTDARLLFDRLNISVIDVTRRSIEETAAAILTLLSEARGAGA